MFGVKHKLVIPLILLSLALFLGGVIFSHSLNQSNNRTVKPGEVAKPEPTPKNTSPASAGACVDYRGNPVKQGCEAITDMGRSCSKTSDCQATCGQGCVNRNYLQEKNIFDCETEPEYSCDCVDSTCQAVK